MIRHIFCISFKEHALGRTGKENGILWREMCESLKDLVPGVLSMEISTDIISASQHYDYAIFTTHDTLENFNKFMEHPVHLKVKELVKDSYENRHLLNYEIKKGLINETGNNK